LLCFILHLRILPLRGTFERSNRCSTGAKQSRAFERREIEMARKAKKSKKKIIKKSKAKSAARKKTPARRKAAARKAAPKKTKRAAKKPVRKTVKRVVKTVAPAAPEPIVESTPIVALDQAA
jgi:hypothetical protein